MQFEFSDFAKLILVSLITLEHREVLQHCGFQQHCEFAGVAGEDQI